MKGFSFFSSFFFFFFQNLTPSPPRFAIPIYHFYKHSLPISPYLLADLNLFDRNNYHTCSWIIPILGSYNNTGLHSRLHLHAFFKLMPAIVTKILTLQPKLLTIFAPCYFKCHAVTSTHLHSAVFDFMLLHSSHLSIKSLIIHAKLTPSPPRHSIP